MVDRSLSWLTSRYQGTAEGKPEGSTRKHGLDEHDSGEPYEDLQVDIPFPAHVLPWVVI